MPENDNENSTPSNEAEASEQRPTEAQPTEATADPKNYRYTAEDGVQDWMIGKTPQEVAQTASQLAEAMQSFDPGQRQTQPQTNQSGQNVAQQRQQWQQAQQQMQGTPQQNGGPQPPDPDLQYEDPARWQQQFDQYMRSIVNDSIQQAAGQVGQSVGQMARSVVAQEPSFQEVFQRWGHEVDKLLTENGVPAAQRTPDTYRMAAKIVKSDHVDEIVQDRVERSQAGSPNATERASQSGSPGSPQHSGDVVDEFWRSDHKYVQRLKEDDISKAEFRQSIRRMNLDPKTYIENLKSQNVITAGNTFTTPDVAGTARKGS